MEIKKVVMKLNIHDDKDKQKAMKAVSSLTGINSVEVDMEESKMTVIGEVDPVSIVSKLKKQWNAQIVTVGPAKEEEKDDEKDDNKDDDNTQIVKLLEAYNTYKPALPTYNYYQIIDDNPNSCAIS